MNIFPTSLSAFASAKALDDKRVVRQASEAIMILATANHVLGLPAHYKPHQPEHGLVQWLAASPRNWWWGYKYAFGCNRLYTAIYGKACISLPHLIAMGKAHRQAFPDRGPQLERPTQLHNAARDRSRNLDFTGEPDTLLAYRQYLVARWGLDKRAPVWSQRSRPSWAPQEAV